ncbi:hypothetical protein FNH08_39175 [Streptomyces spongiae]|uniref:Uncharacterized protein n=1 Tax=Streptomyces spongiae TaxID=565072 RepID=A0A5N8XW91_9ACTN|nr:hypothetical protein [Streptomyces spongiae]
MPATASGAAPAPRRGLHALTHRWPTALALALMIALFGSDSGDLNDAVAGYGEFLPLLPLLYVVISQAGNPRVTWPVLGAGVVVTLALQAQDALSPPHVLVGVALAVLLWGTVRGAPHGRVTWGIQAAGALVFGALALTGLAVDPEVGRWLVAAGWFLHGVWDFAHLLLARLRGIVSRAFAEWCAVVDVLVAVELVFLR